MAIKYPTMTPYKEYCADCPFLRAVQVVSIEYDPNTGHGQLRTLKCEHAEACRRMHDIMEGCYD